MAFPTPANAGLPEREGLRPAPTQSRRVPCPEQHGGGRAPVKLGALRQRSRGGGEMRRSSLACLARVMVSIVLCVAPALAVEQGDFTQGESVYKEICFACHGLTGDGKGPSWLANMPRPQVFIDTNY